MRQVLAIPTALRDASDAGRSYDVPLTDLIVYVGAAHRCTLARQAGTAPALSLAELKVLRAHAGIDAGAVLTDYRRAMEGQTDQLRLASVDMDAHAVTIGKLPTLTDDGRKLTVTVAKDAPNRDALKLQRAEQTMAQHARNLSTVLAGLSSLWRECVAAGIAVRALTLPSAKAKPGKRLESHASALIASDPGMLAQALKAALPGIDEATLGVIVALAAAKAKAATPATAPTALPAPVAG